MKERTSRDVSSATLRPAATWIMVRTYSILMVILVRDVQYHQARNSLGSMSRLVTHRQHSLFKEKFPIAAKIDF